MAITQEIHNIFIVQKKTHTCYTTYYQDLGIRHGIGSQEVFNLVTTNIFDFRFVQKCRFLVVIFSRNLLGSLELLLKQITGMTSKEILETSYCMFL